MCSEEWVVKVVGSEVRVLHRLRVGPSLALMLQLFHSCHRLLVPPIIHNNSWQRKHSVSLTKDATLLPV